MGNGQDRPDKRMVWKSMSRKTPPRYFKWKQLDIFSSYPWVKHIYLHYWAFELSQNRQSSIWCWSVKKEVWEEFPDNLVPASRTDLRLGVYIVQSTKSRVELGIVWLYDPDIWKDLYKMNRLFCDYWAARWFRTKIINSSASSLFSKAPRIRNNKLPRKVFKS